MILQQIIQLLDLTEITTHPGYKIDVHLLGPLTLFLGFEEVDDRGWQRDKAKELLAYFLLNRERYIPKEEIMRELWDSSDEKAADRDFKVTLNALLKVLEPHRKARESSFFIIRKQTMYKLNPKAVISTDLDEFHRYAKKGLAGTFDFRGSRILVESGFTVQRSAVRREIDSRLDHGCT